MCVCVHVPHGRIYGAKSCLSSLNSSTEFDLSHADVHVAFCSLRIATGLCAGRMLVCVRARRHGEYMLILAEQDYSGGRIHTQTQLCLFMCFMKIDSEAARYHFVCFHGA